MAISHRQTVLHNCYYVFYLPMCPSEAGLSSTLYNRLMPALDVSQAAPRAVRRKWPCLTPFAGGDDRSVCCSPRPRRHAKCPQLCRSAGDGGSVKGGGGSLSHDGGELSTEFPFSSDTVLTRLSAVSDGEVSRCASSGANMDGDASSVDENEALTGCLSDGGDVSRM